MKYTCEILIDLPRDHVLQHFENLEAMSKWQTGFISLEHVSGEPGQQGAVSTLRYEMNGRKIEMTETITSRNLPDEMSMTYEAKGVVNYIRNLFSEAGGQTRWVAENEFQLSGFMAVMGFFGKGQFIKQTQNDMERFKVYAEGEG
jgi:uncharacterized membrane protein